MQLAVSDKEVPVEDLETMLRDALNKGLPIDWKLFVLIESRCKCDHPVYRGMIDLFLRLNILSLEQDGNIVLRVPDATSSQSIGNPRHYLAKDVKSGNNPLFFRRDQDAKEYIKAVEELRYLTKGYQAQRIHVIKCN